MHSGKIFWLFIFTLIGSGASSQNLIGNWYSVHRGGINKLGITNDSIKLQRLTVDFAPRGKKDKAMHYLKIVPLNDKTLIIYKSEKDTSKYSALVVINLKENKYFQSARNVSDTAVVSIDTLVKIYKNDTYPLFGDYMFSEHYIDTLKKLKPIADMPFADYKKYAKTYVNEWNRLCELFEPYNKGYYPAVPFNYELMIEALYSTGYNPFVSLQEMNSLHKKYGDKHAAQKIFDKMKGKENKKAYKLK